MAYDKVVDSSVLDAGLKAIADAIREKGGTSDNLAFPTAMAEAIKAIEAGGGDIKVTMGTITPSSQVTSLTIEHGLGVVPNFFLFTMPGSYGDTTYSTSTIVASLSDNNMNQLTIYRTTSNNRFRGYVTINNTYDLAINLEEAVFNGSSDYGHLENATESTIEFRSATNYKLNATKYIWLAGRFDSNAFN